MGTEWGVFTIQEYVLNQVPTKQATLYMPGVTVVPSKLTSKKVHFIVLQSRYIQYSEQKY